MSDIWSTDIFNLSSADEAVDIFLIVSLSFLPLHLLPTSLNCLDTFYPLLLECGWTGPEWRAGRFGSGLGGIEAESEPFTASHVLIEHRQSNVPRICTCT